MLEKRLGKIDFAEFGTMRDYSFETDRTIKVNCNSD